MPAAEDTVKSLFFAALDRAPAERTAFLDSACQGDNDLRRRVEALLHAAQAADPLLDRPAAYHLQSAEPTPPEQSTSLPAEATSLETSELTQAGRFRLQGEIARGGMGVVLRAHDPALDRALAVKVVLPQYRGSRAITHRFLGEARLAGQLQHPGVVPVHELGQLADGRPFFAMKLIEGRTLAELLLERPQPGHDLPRFLRYFQAVCQAIGYAHSRGVIHRDLKPANIMVGAFGEVQVMDWGLAKRLVPSPTKRQTDRLKVSRPQVVAEDPELTNLDLAVVPVLEEAARTQPGSVMGTPAYAAPEQASGAVERLDQRSDVFGLGAILCEVLTGQPPYVADSALQIHRLAARAELADAQARLRGCGADAELVELALSCLAPQPADRPRDGQAVAEALTAYLDGVQARLRQAELAEAEARAIAAGEAKRRRLGLALAGTVLLAVSLAAGTALWLQADHQARQSQVTHEVGDALGRVAELRERTRAGTAESASLSAQAREQLQRALTLVQTGPADVALRAQVERLREELDEEEKDRQFVAALAAALLVQAERVPGQRFFSHERAVPLFREAFRAYGVPAGEGAPAAAAARLRRPLVRRSASAALEEWIDLAVSTRYQVREPHLDWLRAVADAGPDDEVREIHAAWREKDADKRRAALERVAEAADVQKLSPSALSLLARRLLSVRSRNSAVQLLRRARRQYPMDFWLNEQLGTQLWSEPGQGAEAIRYLTAAVTLHPASPVPRLELGYALQVAGQLDDAIASYEQALALDPNYAAVLTNLGALLVGKGEVDRGIACYRKAIDNDPKDAFAYTNLGNALSEKGAVDEAITCHRKAVELEPELATAHSNLGATLYSRGQVDEAIACYRKAIALDPTHAVAHGSLGLALAAKRQFDEAIAAYRKAIEIDPSFAAAHYHLGLALGEKGEEQEAIACFRKAIALAPKVAAPHYDLGVSLGMKGELDEAIACYRQTIALDPKHARAHNNLGKALLEKGRPDEALACCRKAIEMDPKLAEAHVNLGTIQEGMGQLDEAIACYKKALALDATHAGAHYNLGNALYFRGKPDEAITCWRKAIELSPKFAEPHVSLGNALYARGKVDEAIPCWRKAIALSPGIAGAHFNLGVALLCKGEIDEALSCFRRTIALTPQFAPAHYNLGNALQARGKLDEAIVSFRKAVELAPEFAEAQCKLGRALVARGDFTEALAALKRGHELGSRSFGWPYRSDQWVRNCEELIAREKQLLELLAGKSRPASARERLEWARLCMQTRRYVAAARLWSEAFTAEPKLADELKAGERYQAARAAALAAAGKDRDGGKLDNGQKAGLNKQALAWVKADLAARAKQPAGERAEVLRYWLADEALASVRGDQSLRALAEADRVAWAAFWSEVRKQLHAAEGP
jgi:serine/threonine-protein kinase